MEFDGDVFTENIVVNQILIGLGRKHPLVMIGLRDKAGTKQEVVNEKSQTAYIKFYLRISPHNKQIIANIDVLKICHVVEKTAAKMSEPSSLL